MIKKRQLFHVRHEAARFRFAAATAANPAHLTGYAMVWGTPGKADNLSDDRGGYRVRLLPGSAHPAPKVMALANHNWTTPLGSDSSGTLTMQADDYGLRVGIDLPDTSWAKDLCAVMDHLKDKGSQAPEMGMSFGMLWDGQEFYESKEDLGGADTTVVRNYSVFNYDEVSTTPIPAFGATSIEQDAAPADDEEPARQEAAAAKAAAVAADKLAAGCLQREQDAVELAQLELASLNTR